MQWQHWRWSDVGGGEMYVKYDIVIIYIMEVLCRLDKFHCGDKETEMSPEFSSTSKVSSYSSG
jgi:hypothetical protein